MEYYQEAEDEVNGGEWDDAIKKASDTTLLILTEVTIAAEKIKSGVSATEKKVGKREKKEVGRRTAEEIVKLAELQQQLKDANMTDAERDHIAMEERERLQELKSLTDDIKDFYYMPNQTGNVAALLPGNKAHIIWLRDGGRLTSQKLTNFAKYLSPGGMFFLLPPLFPFPLPFLLPSLPCSHTFFPYFIQVYFSRVRLITRMHPA